METLLFEPHEGIFVSIFPWCKLTTLYVAHRIQRDANIYHRKKFLCYRRRSSEWRQVRRVNDMVQCCFSLPKTCPNHTLFRCTIQSVRLGANSLLFVCSLFAIFHAHFRCEAHKRFHIKIRTRYTGMGRMRKACARALTSCTGQLRTEK